VKFHVINRVGDSLWVYVQGAPGLKLVPANSDEMVTFDDVADLGPGVLQPTVGTTGLYRHLGGQPYADVQPGQTVSGGSVIRTSAGGGKRGFGAGKISWKPDGSALAYAMRTNTAIRQIPAVPPYGSTGVDLPVVEAASPRLVAWGTTAATKDQYLYSSDWNLLKKDIGGIYLNAVGNASGGTQLVIIPDYSGQIAHDIEWLPDGSGFLFTLKFVQFPPDPPGTYSDVFKYDFASKAITRLTSLRYDSDAGGARGLSISPDGRQIVFDRVVSLDDPTSDSASSVWIINRDGTGLHKLADNAGRPAWGRTRLRSESHPAPRGEQ
jgi:hypothetical protein